MYVSMCMLLYVASTLRIPCTCCGDMYASLQSARLQVKRGSQYVMSRYWNRTSSISSATRHIATNLKYVCAIDMTVAMNQPLLSEYVGIERFQCTAHDGSHV